VNEEERIRGFVGHVVDSLGIWSRKREKLENMVKSMEDEKKQIQLGLEMEEKERIVFLDVKIRRGRKGKGVKTKWYQRESNSGIHCKRRSDIDEGTQRI
jgi:hypothetical protein